MLWVIGGGMILIWLFLAFILSKSGYIHLLLILGISLLVIQFAAYRKTRYHRNLSEK